MNSQENTKNEKRALLIINPVAGRKLVQKQIHQIVRIFMDAGYLVTTMVTSSRGEASEMVRMNGTHHNLIVCAGGDGTLNEVISGLAAENIRVPLGYIPCGSTNEFAEAHGLATDLVTAASNIASNPIVACDIGRFGDRVFASAALFGAFSWMSYTTDQELKNRLGMGAYVLDGVHDLSRLRPYHVTVTTNGVPHEGEYLFGAVSNAPSLAGILQYPNSLVKLDDGLLEVLLIRMPRNLTDWQQLLRSIHLREYQACPLIEIQQAADIWIDNPPDLEWSLDGERSGPFRTAHISPMTGFLQLKG